MLGLLLALGSAALIMEHEEKSFVYWMREHGKLYTGDEYHMRLGVWLTNLRYVQEQNAVRSFSVGMNSLADLTPSEYRGLLGFKIDLRARRVVQEVSKFKANDELDWRKKGVVNPIKDQGQCGSCWAFSAIQSIESADAIKTGKLLSFSESNLVDCVTKCSGCNGGSMVTAFQWIIEKQGGKLNLESDYPYHPVKGTCKFDASKGVGSISKYIGIKAGSEDDLAAKCAQYGPVAVAIDAGHNSFQLYTGGIYSEPDCFPLLLDHGVGCVGYGTEGATDFWIVKNSWGTKWGEAGYIRMIRKDNQCGIATMADVAIA
jgi:cathepsin L